MDLTKARHGAKGVQRGPLHAHKILTEICMHFFEIFFKKRIDFLVLPFIRSCPKLLRNVHDVSKGRHLYQVSDS